MLTVQDSMFNVRCWMFVFTRSNIEHWASNIEHEKKNARRGFSRGGRRQKVGRERRVRPRCAAHTSRYSECVVPDAFDVRFTFQEGK